MAKEVKYSETGQSLLIKALGYSPKLRIIDIFLIKSLNDIITEMSLQIGKREAEKRVTSQNPTEQTPDSKIPKSKSQNPDNTKIPKFK